MPHPTYRGRANQAILARLFGGGGPEVPLKKPPLVEVWMSFRFEAAAGAPAWTRERYRPFFSAIVEKYPDVQEMVQHEVQVETSKRGRKPQAKTIAEQVLAMRAFTEDHLRAVQLTPDELVVNYLRSETDPYPGFQNLLSEALAHRRLYSEIYQPNGVLEAALHYVDVVTLPIPDSKILRSEEYLTLDFRVPEEVFGTFSAFEIKAIVRPKGAEQPVQMGFATLPAVADATHRPFRLEWHTPVRGSGRLMDVDELRTNLVAAHNLLDRCFRHAFTEKGWALFEPE